jgi:hypothetical protein
MTNQPGSSARAPELSWKAHPFKERHLAGILTSLLILALGASIFVATGSLAGSVLGILVLVLALNRFYFPSRFEIDPEGISAHYLLSRERYEWSSVRRFLWDRRGAYLSTRARASWLDAYRGLTVLYGAHQAEIMKLIRRHMDEATSK